jgi:transcription elongation factor GreA
MSIANPILEARSWPRAIPMTRDVLRRLQGDAERLVEQLPRLQMLAQENGVSGDPDSPTIMAAGDLHLAARRLETLRRVIADGLVVEPDGRIVVGSRIGVRHADGESETYDLVAPGETDARLGRISPDSPLGAALLGRRADDVTHMDAPCGSCATDHHVSQHSDTCARHAFRPRHGEGARHRSGAVRAVVPRIGRPSWTGASI